MSSQEKQVIEMEKEVGEEVERQRKSVGNSKQQKGRDVEEWKQT